MVSPETTIELFKEISDIFHVERSESGFSFTFDVSEESLKFIEKIENKGFPEFSVSIEGHYKELLELYAYKGQQASAEISKEDLIRNGVFVYSDWNSLLKYRPNLSCPLPNFFVIEDNSTYPSHNPSGKLKHYLDTCKVVDLLISNADHVEKLSNKVIDEVIYLHKSKLEVPILYAPECLKEGLDGISVVNEIFEDVAHSDQKKSILKEVLHSLLSNIPTKDRLGYLLKHFGEFSKRIHENYSLFVSDFSFDKVRKEYEESKRVYVTKLNDIFTSAQTKMLGVPVALAVSSLKVESIVNKIDFWSNLFLLIAFGLYGVMMIQLVKNHKHTLTAIKSEYSSQMNRLKHHYSDQYDLVESIEDDLNKRHDYQKNCLNGFYVMAALLILPVVGFFIYNLPWKSILGIA